MRDEYIYQHYVPKSHLDHFTSDKENDRVWVFDKPTESAFPQATSDVGGDEFFYDPKWEPKAEVEEFLRQVENAAHHPYDVIVQTKSISCVTQQDKRDLANFLALQWMRTEERRNSIRDVGKLVEETLEERFGIEWSMGDEEEIEREIAETHSAGLTMDEVEEISDILMEKRWFVMENLTDKPLWTSDHPIVSYNQREFPEWANGKGLAVEGVQVFFPLTPDLMLQMADPTYFWMGPRDSILIDEDNITFYNELQIYQSNRQLYSSEDNFKLAEETIERIPDLKDPHRKRFKRLG